MTANTRPPVIPAALLIPTETDLADARRRLRSGDSFASTYAGLGVAVSGMTAEMIRAALAGDVAGLAGRLRRLAALDQVGAERRAEITARDRANRPARRPALRVVSE